MFSSIDILTDCIGNLTSIIVIFQSHCNVAVVWISRCCHYARKSAENQTDVIEGVGPIDHENKNIMPAWLGRTDVLAVQSAEFNGS